MKFNKNIKKQLKERYGQRCVYCGCYIGDDFTIDHVIPQCRGGTNNIDNLVISCIDCNKEKDDMSFDSFMRRFKNGFYADDLLKNYFPQYY